MMELLTLTVLLVPGCLGRLFPGNQYGKFDVADLPTGVHFHARQGNDHSDDPMYCNGEEQSPIDLNVNPTETVTAAQEAEIQAQEAAADGGAPKYGVEGRKSVMEDGSMELVFGGYRQLSRFQMENTGYGVQGSFPGQKLTLRGSAIPSNTYELQQFHFHWTKDSSEGSEHYVNGKKFAMEMHLVHLSYKFPDVEAALKQTADRHAVLVVGVLIDVVAGGAPNPHFQKIVKSLRCSNRTAPGTKHSDPKFGRVYLYSLIPAVGEGTEKVVTYDGSLTTHGCNEVVSWLVFTEPLRVSEAQVAEFRHLYQSDGSRIAEEGNARKVEPLHKRTMFVKNVVLKTK